MKHMSKGHRSNRGSGSVRVSGISRGPQGDGPGSQGNTVRRGRPLNPKMPGTAAAAVKPGKSG